MMGYFNNRKDQENQIIETLLPIAITKQREYPSGKMSEIEHVLFGSGSIDFEVDNNEPLTLEIE